MASFPEKELAMYPSAIELPRNAFSKAPFNPFWLKLWSIGLAIGWLLPNHYVPWVAFHFDAWIASWLVLAAVVVVIRSPMPVDLHRLAVVCAMVVGVPFVQYWFGLLPFSGQAWIGAAFVLGLLVALILGAHWESVSPGQGVDGLFLAIGIAAVVSVGLQLYQWLGLSFEALDLWVMGSASARQFANFIQPNQLATFLLWALLGSAWGVATGRIGRITAVFMAMFLLFGIALTLSRTALIAIVGLVVATFLWRRLWLSKSVLWVVVGLAAYYFVCLGVQPQIAGALNLDDGPGMAARTGGSELRIPAYLLFLDAAIHKPFVGYGWAQTAQAQFAVAQSHAGLGGIFMQAHNLFLDLILWLGIPLGALLVVALSWWLVDKIRRVATTQNAILVMFVAVVAWHAMLELPLHYAYLLLPTGLVMGVINRRMGEPVIAQARRWHFAALVAIAVALLAVIVRDYMRIEENFFVLRFERAKIGTAPLEPPASVLVLNHMNEFVRLGRTHAKSDMTEEELAWMNKAANAYPSLGNLFTLALALAWNHKTADAQILVDKLPKITNPEEYGRMRSIWQTEATADARLALIYWPN